MIQESGGKHSHGVYVLPDKIIIRLNYRNIITINESNIMILSDNNTHGTKWVLIKLVDPCFTSEFQLN